MNRQMRHMAVLSLLALVAAGRSARADVVLIDDLTDTITMSLNGNVVTTCLPTQTNEDCVLNPIFSGLGTINNLPLGSVSLYIDDGNGHVSDVLAISAGPVFAQDNMTFQAVGVEFVSDLDPGFADVCSNHPGGCVFTETGNPQLATTITWTGGTSLGVSFQSDLDTTPIPEPSFLMLLGSALMVLGGASGKRKFFS